MKTSKINFAAFLAGTLVLAGTVWGQEPATGEETPTVVKVEETWRVEVGEPNLERNGPQVTLAMSPNGGTSGEFFVFTLNHKNYPHYAAGGSQLTLFNGEHISEYRNGAKEGPIRYTEEVIEWTQRLTVNENGTVTMEVVEGNCPSWGDFGGQGYLKSTTIGTYQSLNGYRTETSLTESEVGFAGNRVAYLTLQRVRWYLADGRVFELRAPIDVDSDLDPWKQ